MRKKIGIMRNRLEYNMSGACVSIFCEPNNVDAASLESAVWLAASWIAS